MDEVCLQCGKYYADLLSLFRKTTPFCRNCLEKATEEIHRTNFHNIPMTYLHLYSEERMGQLISLKGNGEPPYIHLLIPPNTRKILHKQYKDHVFVYMPSNQEEDEERGFRHLEVLFQDIPSQHIYPLYKKIKYKQSNYTKQERMNVKERLASATSSGKERLGVDESLREILQHQRVVLVDDVMSTGATLLAAKELLELNDVEFLVCLMNDRRVSNFVDGNVLISEELTSIL